MEIRKKNFRIHEFVWAKVTGYSYWPAIIMPHDVTAPPQPRDGTYWTYFFGSHNYAWVKEKYIKKYEPNIEKYTAKCSQHVLDAHKELKWNRKRLLRNPNFEMDIFKFVPRERRSRSRPKSSMSTKSGSSSRSRKTRASSVRSRSTWQSRSEDFDDLLSQASEEWPSTPEKPIIVTKKTVGIFAGNLYAEGIIKNLLGYRHRVVVWSTSEAFCAYLKRYAKRTGSLCRVFRTPKDVVKHAAIILSMMSSQEEIKKVLAQLGAESKENSWLRGRAYIEMTTIPHEFSYHLENWWHLRDCFYMEAMVQGTRDDAENRQMVTLLGACTKDRAKIVNEFESCLWSLGKATYCVGEVGSAAKIHEMFQMVKALFLAGFVEVLALADQFVDLNQFLDCFMISPLNSIYLERICENIKNNQYGNVQETIQALQQDLEQILMISEKQRESLPLSSTANQLFKHARRVGLDDRDSSAMYLRARLSV